MKKKILIFAHDPGGCNTVIPLIEPLTDEGYEVVVLGKGPALNKYHQFDVRAKDIDQFLDSDNNIVDLLNELKPSLVITGTSGVDTTERYFWKGCQELNIPSFAILDRWINYKMRFKAPANFEKEMCFPSKILVMDEFAKEEMIDEKIPDEKIVITGQPYFEYLKKEYEKIEISKSFYDDLALNSKKYLVTFVSEPLSKVFKNKKDNEKTIFKALASSLNQIAEESGKEISLVVKLHPKEDIFSYDDVLDEIDDSNLDVKIVNEINHLKLIKASELVVGMSSMMLIEAALVGKPCISVLIGLGEQYPFVLDRLKMIKSVTTNETLNIELLKQIEGADKPEYSWDVIENPVENIINLVKQTI